MLILYSFIITSYQFQTWIHDINCLISFIFIYGPINQESFCQASCWWVAGIANQYCIADKLHVSVKQRAWIKAGANTWKYVSTKVRPHFTYPRFSWYSKVSSCVLSYYLYTWELAYMYGLYLVLIDTGELGNTCAHLCYMYTRQVCTCTLACTPDGHIPSSELLGN